MPNNLSLSNKPTLWNNLDFRRRVVFLLCALIVFRIGVHVPVPGVDAAGLARSYSNSSGSGILGLLNMFSGGALERFSIFAIGIMPYISASIIMQLAVEVIPKLKELKKEGDVGRKAITKYTRIGTVILATVQSLFAASVVIQQGVVVIDRIEFYISAISCLVGGTLFLMWLGEQITERGIGNGISLLITAGIVSTFPVSAIQIVEAISRGDVVKSLLIVLSILALIVAIVFFESALRKIPVNYARGQNLNYGNSSTHIPLKLNMSGVIPPIFASSLIAFPALVSSWAEGFNSRLITRFLSLFQHGTLSYMLLFSILVVFFCFFYTALVFSPKEMADNLKKSAAFIPSIRPGEKTAYYLEQVVLKLTFWGAIYITLVCLIPEVFTYFSNIQVYIGGTSLLILVVVTMDFMVQISSYRMTQQYEVLTTKK